MEIIGVDRCEFVDYTLSNDFYFYEVGNYKCVPGYSYGPVIRPQTIFHYVISGKGFLVLNDKRYEIHENQGFLIPLNCLAYYEADTEDPWEYVWLHVDGPRAKELFAKAGLSIEDPIFSPSNSAVGINKIVDEIYEHITEECYCMGKIYEFFNILIQNGKKPTIESENTQLSYVKKVIRYIQVKYSENITIEEIALICGLNRSYLSRLFKEATGYTPNEYLLKYRMTQASKMLKETDYSVSHISYLVGYSDSFTFSKAFKRYYSQSPSAYRMQKAEQAEGLLQ